MVVGLIINAFENSPLSFKFCVGCILHVLSCLLCYLRHYVRGCIIWNSQLALKNSQQSDIECSSTVRVQFHHIVSFYVPYFCYFFWLQENIRRCVCIVYDPSRSNQGVLALKALKLSDSFMDLYKNNNFTGEKYALLFLLFSFQKWPKGFICLNVSLISP